MVYLNISLHQVIGFRVKNTHNYIWDDYSTKQVTLKISSSEMKSKALITSDTVSGVVARLGV